MLTTATFEDFLPVVTKAHKKRGAILKIANKYPTPFYLFDQDELKKSITDFVATFEKVIPNLKAYYAIKSNSHPLVLKTVLKCGLGLDISSGRELEIALDHGTKNILFSGPGKTDEKLRLAVKNNTSVTINIDNFSELKRLGSISKKEKKTINAGVRIFTKHHGLWNKFGIPLNDLKDFWLEAEKYPYIKLKGIQFHTSHNEDAQKYELIIKDIADYLKKNFTQEMRDEIKFVDFGGGFMPDGLEGCYEEKDLEKKEIKILALKSMPIKSFAKTISGALKKHLNPLLNCTYYCEPGRIFSTKAMHLVLRITDVKNEYSNITDGGTNMVGVGWGFGEKYFFPIVNLTHPSKSVLKTAVYGSLCTPRDVWGYHCYASKMTANDILVIPNQGAYTYSMAQSFIKEIPAVYALPSGKSF